jgi:hypothetical protein
MLLDRQPVTNSGANWLRKTAKIRTASLAFRESIVFEKVCSVGDEAQRKIGRAGSNDFER